MKRFHTLDGLRGFAAIFVMLWHIQQSVAPNLPIMPSSYLAVDLFFLISGFVIANGYNRKLESGMTLLRFTEVRAIRLAPLYYLGCAFSFVLPVFELLRNGGLWHLKATVYSAVPALFLLPDFTRDRGFTLNPPGWSLHFEMVVNILFAAGIFRLRTSRLSKLVFCLAFAFLLASFRFVEPASLTVVAWLYHLLRTAFSFFAGSLIYHLWRSHNLPSLRVPVLIMIASMVFCMMKPQTNSTLDLLSVPVIILAFPLILIAASQNEPGPKLRPLFTLLGDLSYPIYAIHYPLLTICNFVLGHEGFGGMTVAVSTAITTAIVAWLASNYVDIPIRRAISRKLHLRRQLMDVAPAL